MFQANLTEVLLEYFPLVICVLKIQCECKLKCVQSVKTSSILMALTMT